MRFLIVAGAIALLALPVTAQACGASTKAQASTVEYVAAAKKKPMKTAAKKTKKPKVEYMRAAPM